MSASAGLESIIYSEDLCIGRGRKYFDSWDLQKEEYNKYYLPSRLQFSFHASVVKALQLCLLSVPRSKPMILSSYSEWSTVLKSLTDSTALKMR